MFSGRPAPGAFRGSSSILDAPVFRALFIQLISFALVLVLAHGLALAGIGVTIAHAALLQGGVAAAISRRRAMPSWWIVIQLLFPIAAIAVLALRLQPWIFIAAFAALLALYWTTFRTQVPYFPSSRAVRDAVAGLLPTGRAVRFIDIGSGFGGLPIHLARQRPESAFVGIEIAPLPWLFSLLRARCARSGVHFIRGDYGRGGLGDFDVVFAYLSPAAMPALWRQACSQMRPGSLLLSYEFGVPGADAHIVLHPREGGPPLLGWYF